MREWKERGTAAHDKCHADEAEFPAHQNVALARPAARGKDQGGRTLVCLPRSRLDMVEDDVGRRGLLWSA